SHIFVKEKYSCNICNCNIKNANKLVRHIMHTSHVKKIIGLQMEYPLEALAFWMHTLNIAQKNPPWWLDEKKKPLPPAFEIGVWRQHINNGHAEKMMKGGPTIEQQRGIPFMQHPHGFPMQRLQWPLLPGPPHPGMMMMQTGPIRPSTIHYQHHPTMMGSMPSQGPGGFAQFVYPSTAAPAAIQYQGGFPPIGLWNEPPVGNMQPMQEGMINIQMTPAVDTRLTQPLASLTAVINSGNAAEATPISAIYPPIFPPPGVDPFALLNSCIGARRKLKGNIFGRFKKLRVNFDRCDIKRLVQQTSHLFAEDQGAKMCSLCNTKKLSPDSVVTHICSFQHISAMEGVVSADAFDFWWNAVQNVGKKPSKIEMTWIADRRFPPEPDRCSSKTVPLDASIPHPNSPLALLFHYRHVPDPCPNVRSVVTYMGLKIPKTDPHILKNEESVAKIFSDFECVSCSMCSSFAFDITNPESLLAHIVSNQHVTKMLADGGQVDMDALFFWIDKMTRAGRCKINIREQVASAPVRCPLNRLLVAGVVDPNSPIAVLAHCKNVDSPCQDIEHAFSVLKRMFMRIIDSTTLNEEFSLLGSETFYCGMCPKHSLIRNGRELIQHIVFSTHIKHATECGGRVDKKVLLFWLDALYAGTDIIFPREVEAEVLLFGGPSVRLPNTAMEKLRITKREAKQQ
ncbi:hypothetical protein PENTCL1PPCAC_8069, partial [Pristionchus entomophagus]